MISGERLDAIEKRVRGSGGEVVALLKTGSAFYSPAASAIAMAEAYLFDRKKLLPAAALCNGEYGVKGIYLGVPVIMGSSGVERVVEIELNTQEKAQLAKSADGVKSIISIL